MRFEDIPPIAAARYEVDVSWLHLEMNLASYAEQGLNLDPDFQRPHVWTESQQVRFVEHMLAGGTSPRHIYFNAPRWREGKGPIELIDGKQRLAAARKFLRNELGVFGGHLYCDMGQMTSVGIQFRFHVHSFQTRAEVLEWYLQMNSGGSVHTEEEIARVQAMLDAERAAAG
jgi:hypothetical protein